MMRALHLLWILPMTGSLSFMLACILIVGSRSDREK